MRICVIKRQALHDNVPGQQCKHVQIQFQRLALKRGALRETAGLGERQRSHREPHRRKQPKPCVGEAHVARKHLRELGLNERTNPGRREQDRERAPREADDCDDDCSADQDGA